ncbi:MAG: FAD-dependent oxidoreductase, partial [Myxococcales bacterium]|nr:FAD-dependent oxidoreductase [Myxococcales bacterium]
MRAPRARGLRGRRGAPDGRVAGAHPPHLHRPAARRVNAATTGGDLDLRVAVIGGGLAGLAAATVLAERGAEVVLLEREPVLGGRLAAWPTKLATGETVRMERGFHAFFRHYANVRALLRRVDPELRRLVPLEDYPLLGPDGARESFSGLPTTTPWNVAEIVRRSPHFRLKDLARVDVGQALAMLTFDREATYARFDRATAKDYLDSLRFPEEARRMLFDVFAHSFFNPEEEMSAAELLMMFHFYFTGNPEGLVFDVLDDSFSTSFLDPLAAYLGGLGAEVRTGTAAARVTREGGELHVHLAREGRPLVVDALVLALPVPALKALHAASPALADPAFDLRVGRLDVTRPFAVWRLWLDRPLDPGREPFVGTTGLGRLDNVSLYHLFEAESRAWAARHGGSVVELHAYGVVGEPSDDALRAELLAGLHAIYPEARGAGVLDERWLVRRDCPAFA